MIPRNVIYLLTTPMRDGPLNRCVSCCETPTHGRPNGTCGYAMDSCALPSNDVQLSNKCSPIEAVRYLENIFRLAQPLRDLQQPHEPRTVLLVELCCSLSHNQWKGCCAIARGIMMLCLLLADCCWISYSNTADGSRAERCPLQHRLVYSSSTSSNTAQQQISRDSHSRRI